MTQFALDFSAIANQRVSPSRRSDPATSQESAESNSEVRGKQRIAVYGYLLGRGEEGATDYEIGQALGILRTSAGKRRKELQESGKVEKTDRRRFTDSLSSAIVWRAK